MKKFWLIGILVIGISVAAVSGFTWLWAVPDAPETAVSPLAAPDQPCSEHLGTPEFYRCREELNACGPDGYYLGYAEKYCDRFQRETRPLMTAAGQDWLDCTLVCLQEHVMDNIPVDANCDDAMASAIAAHNGCYLECGICSLPPGDMDLVQNTIDGSDLVLDEVLPVGYTCIATQKRSPLPTEAFQMECVIERGGCPQTGLDEATASAETWQQLNDQCRAQTGYQGANVQPAAADCSRWAASLAAVLETRGLAVTTGVWQGAYFDNPDLAGEPVLERDEKGLAFDWGDTAPAAGVPADDFSARWSRELNLLPGRYLYVIDAQGGVRLWVNGELIIDQWHTPPAAALTGEIDLPGGLNQVALAYRSESGPDGVEFVWTQIPNFVKDR